jgi:diaminopimelate epimerase
MRFVKYHALGNDYLVFDSTAQDFALTPQHIQRICHRHYGLGSDGVLVTVTGHSPPELKIFNPDGSEAEKSGNGLRIFARWLFDEGLVGDEPFFVQTLGGQVRCCVLAGGRTVQVEMGQVVFEALDETIDLAHETAMDKLGFLKKPSLSIARTPSYQSVYIVNIGNPHCVVFCELTSSNLAQTLGPLIENHPRFPNRTNVQFVQVLDRSNIRLEIWERGAGYTLASGSSSCAAAAMAVKLGVCDSTNPITAHMPGGALTIEISPDFFARMTGPVTRVATMVLDPEALK